MAYVTGLMLIDAPASALNNLGKIAGSMTDNATGVKFIKTKEGNYPYVSAQAFRYWLRQTLEQGAWGWQTAPIYREQKIAYTDANPIRYWDDDLFGYMRAPSKRDSAVKAREADENRVNETPTTDTITRISPFRVSTFVSVAPVSLVNDFGVMSRHEGNPVPHEHQFYRATLQGLFSLDLHAAGTFTYKDKTGYLNLDQVRIEEAKKAGLEDLTTEKAFRLPGKQRFQRISALLKALSFLDGGAKQALHYTDVSPDLVFAAVTKGGNNIFGHIVNTDAKGLPVINIDALKETLEVHEEDIISDIYVGWVKGYLEGERTRFEEALNNKDGQLKGWRERISVKHPREALNDLAEALKTNVNWLD